MFISCVSSVSCVGSGLCDRADHSYRGLLSGVRVSNCA